MILSDMMQTLLLVQHIDFHMVQVQFKAISILNSEDVCSNLSRRDQNCMSFMGSRFQRGAYVVPIGAIDEEKNWKRYAILDCTLP